MDLASAAYVDEEDCLGFKIWVAELELIVGGSRGNKKADPAQVFLLLQKLVVTLERTTERSEIREYQRRAEDALIDILLKGAPPPVRRLVCEALSKLYARGDQLPLFSRMSSLQLFLGTREAAGKETSAQIRLGALELMAALYYSQGRSLSIGVLETAAMAVKYCSKGSDDATRRAALRLLAAAVEGVGGGHRGAVAVQQEVLKAVEKLLKERELPEPVRLGIADALRAVAAVGGAALWAFGLTGYDVARTACLAGLDDPSGAVRAGYARALGELVTAAASPAAKDSMASAGPKAKAQAAQGKALSAVREQCLSAEFAEAAAASNRPVCTALTQAWVHHLSAVRLACGVDEAAFLDPAMSPLEALAAACIQAGAVPEKGLSGTDSELGAGISAGERPHAQACMLYIMRAGVLEQLGEAGQRLLLEKLTALLGTDAPVATPVGVVALELVALLAEALGELGPEASAALEPAIAGRLVGSHAALRLQAASALAALAVAEPGSAARLMGSTLSNLRAAADALVEAAAAGPDKSRPAAGTPRGVGCGRLKLDMNALHGWALGAAALVAASPRLPLGLPSHYVSVAAQIAAALVEAPRCQFAAAACLEREAGYVLLGALCQVAPEELTVGCGGAVLALWVPALGAQAAAALDALFKSSVSNTLEHTLAAELWWRTAALQSLASFIHGVVGSSPAEEQDRLLGDVAGLLRHVLRLLPSHAALQDPARCKGGPGSVLAGASATLQLRLLQAYSALPSAAAYAADHEALSTLCLGAVGAAAAAGNAELVLPALRAALDERDDSLGPWNFGRDPLERALLSFQGAAGGPLGTAWHAGLRAGVGYAMDTAAAAAPRAGGGGAYPQPQALAPALYAAQASLLGAVLRAVPPRAQAAIMEGLLSISRSVPPTRKEKRPGKRVAALLGAAAPALAGLGANSPPAAAAAGPALAPLLTALAEEVAAEAANGPALQRTVADLYAAAARLSEDAAALQLVRQLCREAAETPSLPRRASLALSVGSACRAVGGLGLAAVVPVAAQTLMAVAAASSRAIAPWVLQALMSCANAAGLAFVPQVKPALALAQAVLLSEEIYSTPGLLPAVGRLANALVAALGPDYALGSAAYDACRSVVSELRAPDTGGVRRPEDSLEAALESVLYAQMLVLFSPRALPAAQHVAVLVSTLPSRQPQLRKAAADTLRHLAERDALAVLEERVEPALLAALDSETDPATAAQLQATLFTLLEAGAPLQPSRWVALCSEVVTAAGPADRAASGVDLADSARNAGGGDDDDDFFSSSGPGSAAPPPSAASAAAKTAGPAASSGSQAAVTPRLRTRVFAARCLLEVPALACAADRRHADLATAQADPAGGDWLVERVQALVDLAFRMVSGQLEALRPLGVELMLCVLAHLGDSADPLAEGERLLALYQAHYVSTLRASLALGASPALQAAGAALAAAFLDKGLAGGDAVVLDRLLGLLCTPLAAWGAGSADPAQGAYAEWVAAGAHVALLEAHAHCAVLAARLQGSGADDPTKGVVVRAQGPFLTLLVECWIGLLHDHVVLSTQPAAAAGAHRLGLYGRLGAERAPALALVAAGIRRALQRAWPVAMEAAACTLTHDRTSAYGSAGRERHAALLDLALAGLAEASSAVAAAVAAAAGAALVAEAELRAGGKAGTGLTELKAALHALRRLTAQRFAQEGWLGAALVAECTLALLRLLRTVLAPLAASLSFDAADVASAVEAAAETAHQLAFAAGPGIETGTQGDLLAAADECLALSGRSSAAMAAALAIFSTQVTSAAAGGDAVYVSLLHRSLAAGAAVLRRRGTPDQLTAAVTHITGVAKCAALRDGRHGTASDADLPTPAQVLSSAAVTAAQQAERAAMGARAAQAGAGVGCLLALGAVATHTPAVAGAAEQLTRSAEGTAGDEWGGEWSEGSVASPGAGHAPALALPCSPAQQLCLSVLRASVGSAAPAVRLQALLALRAYLQSLPPPQWAAQCAAAALPATAATVHAAMQRGCSLSNEQEVQAVAEALKIGLLACNLGGGVGAAALAVVVPLLVETAAPPGAPFPALAELAVKLLTALATGPVAAAFRGSVAALPAETKQRLQGALQAAASGGGLGGAEAGVFSMQAAGQALRPPSIQLRAFGGLKKPPL